MSGVIRKKNTYHFNSSENSKSASDFKNFIQLCKKLLKIKKSSPENVEHLYINK